MGHTNEPGGHSAEHPLDLRLDSWKAIAAHLNRDVSTVRRWEKREGLPVHRHLHHKLGSVYAFPSEIDAWWRSRRGRLDPEERSEERVADLLGTPPPVGPGPQDASLTLSARWDRTRVLAVSVAVLFVGVIATVLVATSRARAVPANDASVAVLPFEHRSSASEADVLVDALTEGIINRLSAAPDLKVISRASAFRYKGKKTIDLRKAGRELGVRALLVGRVVQKNDRFSLSVELVDTRDDRQLWGTTFERSAATFGLLSEEVARHVSRTMTGRDHVGASRRYTKDPVTHELYLRGRYHWNKRTPEGFRRAVSEFARAIERDPAYAPAFAGLADSYTLMGYYYNLIPVEDARAKSRTAAMKALELDDSLAEAHMSMAGVLEFERWDWTGAEREYRRAIELAPNYASAYHWYANNLSIRGRHDEAISRGTRAVELDPLSPIVHVGLGHAYYLAGRHDEAIAQLEKALGIEPSFLNARQFLGQVYVEKGLYEEAVAEFRKVDAAERWIWRSALAHAYTRMGRMDAAAQIIRTFRTDRPTVSLVTIAALYAAVGERDQSLELLNLACNRRDPDVSFIKSLPAFESLRGDPAFQAILRRIGLG
jgi:TolB-like protein/Flp pilus assembly protein TadD